MFLLGAQIGMIGGKSAPPPPVYEPDMIDFDGSTWLDRDTVLPNAVDGKLGTFYCRAKKDAAIDGLNAFLMMLATGAVQVFFDTNNKLQLSGRTSANTKILEVNSTNAYTTSAGEIAILLSWDMASAGSMRLYIDDVDDLTEVTYANGTLDYTDSFNAIGSNLVASWSLGWNGCIGQFWFEQGVYFDFDTQSERRKFHGSGGAAIDLGSVGQGPTGAAPLLFFDGAANQWHQNKGDAGDVFTENGTLAACP